jgi:hypothetical protein
MRRPVKINFATFSLEETARELGIPKQRAQRILSLVGADETENGAGKEKRPMVRRRQPRRRLAGKSAS